MKVKHLLLEGGKGRPWKTGILKILECRLLNMHKVVLKVNLVKLFLELKLLADFRTCRLSKRWKNQRSSQSYQKLDQKVAAYPFTTLNPQLGVMGA